MSVRPSRGRAALVAALTAACWVVVSPAPGTGATCTIVGTSKAETLTGTSGADVICGLGGNDTINGNGGDDRIDGGTGDDRITGGAGDDVISGGDGNDTLTGGTGSDDLSGGAGTDTVSYSTHTAAVTADLDGVRDDGSSGEKDYVTTSVENLVGGSGADTLTGSTGPNTLYGGSGNDTLFGGSGADKINGGAGNDKITGAAGADTLDGSTGTNVCDQDGADASVLRCSADSAAPTMTRYAISTNKVDTSAEAKTVTVTVDAKDDFSGVAAVTAKLVGPATYSATGSRKSGSAMSGTYEAVVSIPKDAPKGTYTLQVAAADKQGNSVGPRDTGLKVEQVGEGDKTPPTLTKWAVDQQTVDTSEEAADVTVTVDISDDGAGVETVSVSLVGAQTYNAAATRKAGDAKAGTYEAVVNVPKGAPRGSYDVVVKATDADGNVLEKEVSTVTVGPLEEAQPEPGGDDTTAPWAYRWEVDRISIDTSAGAEEVAITAQVKDAASGVASVVFQLVGPQTYSVAATRTGGTTADGTWQGAVTVPEGAPTGSYTLHIGATDTAGNTQAPKATSMVVKNGDE